LKEEEESSKQISSGKGKEEAKEVKEGKEGRDTAKYLESLLSELRYRVSIHPLLQKKKRKRKKKKCRKKEFTTNTCV